MKKSSRKKLNRTGTAPCDICKERHILEIHHIRGRKIPNHEHPSNVCNVCANCHNKLHYGFIVIEDWVYSSGGKILMWHEKGQESFTGKNAKPHLVQFKGKS